jgi:hypothetical protein
MLPSVAQFVSDSAGKLPRILVPKYPLAERVGLLRRATCGTLPHVHCYGHDRISESDLSTPAHNAWANADALRKVLPEIADKSTGLPENPFSAGFGANGFFSAV